MVAAPPSLSLVPDNCACLFIGAQCCRHLPQKMKGLDGMKISMASCGWRHSVLVDSEGRLLATGWGKYGQLGLGDNENQTVPVHVPMPSGEKVRQTHPGEPLLSVESGVVI